jgi:hypothetical protein
MFPDVLLYEDEAQTRILQGWELKMPDVAITDEAFIFDAIRKAKALGLDSFVIWNFKYGKLYIKNKQGIFEETKVWSGTNYIKNREDVATYKKEWLPILKDIVITVNEFLISGEISAAPYITTVSENLITEIIQRNKDLVAENLLIESNKNMQMESRLNVWWNAFHVEYDKDEISVYSAYAKTVLLNWTNRITFANTIKKFHNCAYRINEINDSTTPQDGNDIIEQIIEEGDFYNVFRKIEFNDAIPQDTWIDIVDYNQFLVSNKIDQIDQSILQDILEHTVNTAKREIRGQYATPYCLADILCQISIENWNSICADLCAGTGTIAKAIMCNKIARLGDVKTAIRTTWLSDKYAYPLQIASLAITDIHAINVPIPMFQADIFSVHIGDKIEIKSPTDGSTIETVIPAFDTIISNLPFVAYNRIADDEIEYINKYRSQIYGHTNIEFTSGKTDLYIYVPFKIYDLLSQHGKLGIILSNSWLGTAIGQKFFYALQFYYEIELVAMSNNKRWFQNADVIGTILVLKKKVISPPDMNCKIQFWLINKNIFELAEIEKSVIINSLVLHEELDASIASNKEYTLKEIEEITRYGITLNALFHDISWINSIADRLMPIEKVLTVKRGERRGWNDLFYPPENSGIESYYLKPVLKNPARLTSYCATTDVVAFCCHLSKEELRSRGHRGALNWIEKFEHIRNGSGILLTDALKRPGKYWYEMDDATKADFVTALNPDRRLFISKFEESTFVDQRFTRMLIRDDGIPMELIHALLNSIYAMFAIEAIGFGRGLGVLDASSNKLKNMFMIDYQRISETDTRDIITLFSKIRNRKVKDVSDELIDADRVLFEQKVLQAIGHEDLYESIKKSLLSMQYTRHCIS